MSKEPWELQGEELIRQIQIVVEERLLYLDVARRLHLAEEKVSDLESRIMELQGINTALRVELLELRGAKPNRKTFGWLAAAVVYVAAEMGSSFVGGLGEGAGAEQWKQMRRIQEQGAVVAAHCDVTVEVNIVEADVGSATEHERAALEELSTTDSVKATVLPGPQPAETSTVSRDQRLVTGGTAYGEGSYGEGTYGGGSPPADEPTDAAGGPPSAGL